MRGKNPINEQREKKHLLLFSLTFLFLFLSLVVLCVGGYIVTHFDTSLPQEIYQTDSFSISPVFYAYRFSDRANRIGVAEDVTDSIYAQAQTAYVPYSDIPKNMVNAFVAIEDKRFFEHEGVDWYRTCAAALNYVFGFSDTFGASTITQQLVKNLTGEDRVSIKRKLQEILYALDLERNVDKTRIMELYLNVIHFSDHCNGIGAAAEHYYSKTPAELSLAECATIAAITNSPTYYNPIKHPENNLQRRDSILFEMYDQGFISEAEYSAAVSSGLNLCVDDVSNKEGVNSWYTDMVIDDVIHDLMQKYAMSRAAATHLVYSGGLRIDVAMDREIQEMVEEYYRSMQGVPQNAKGESAQSALIVIDSHTGDILGVAGARGEKGGNHLQSFATQTLRPPGSTIKPLSIYAPALEKGLIHWSSVYDDVPTDFYKYGRVAWPKNATGVYRGLTNVAYAVAHSTNTVAVRVLRELGTETAFRYLRDQFHISSLVDREGESDKDLAALALGQLNYGVTLRELSTAYTVFADGGCFHPYRSYYRVLNTKGEILLSVPDQSEVVLSKENAAIMTKLLQGVVREGTQSVITLQNTMECAGKTGTTNQDCDRWFIGYTPEWICGVWCGYAYPEPLEGKNICTGIWNTVMRKITDIKGGETEFEVPSTLVRTSYCKDSGMLMSESCTKDPRGNRVETGWFIKGKEPHTFCTCHVLCAYDAEYGGVSHGFCPAEVLQEVGLIRVERHFPIPIYVRDAEYVYRGDPQTIPIHPMLNQPYFSSSLQGHCGVSNREKQFNRSCTFHDVKTEQNEETEDEQESETEPGDLIPIPWLNFEE